MFPRKLIEMRNILIYDLEIEGHHAEYINNIIDHICKQDIQDNFYFATKFDFQRTHSDLYHKLIRRENITFIPITQEQFDYAYEPYLSIKRSIREYFLVKKISKDVKPKSVILLHLNVFQTSISSFANFTRSVSSISGIYFHPFYRMEISNLKDRLNYFRRYIQLKLLLSCSKIDSIFILNDQKTVDGLNKIYETKRFKLLLDPIVSYNEVDLKQSNQIRRKYKINDDSKVFIFLGHLSERKGILSTLDAFLQLEEEFAKQASLLILGIPDEQIRDLIELRVDQLKNSHLCKIVYQPRFLSKSDMIHYFLESDIVLMPYLKSVGSSGIMGHAAQAQKILIGPNFGLLGELIESYNLGLSTDTRDITKLLETIEYSFSYKIEDSHIKGMSKYTNERFPKTFSKTLLQN